MGTVVRQMGDKQGVDIWGLSEARQEFFDDYLRGAGNGESGSFRLIPGSNGNRSQRLAILFDENQFVMVGDAIELDEDPFDVQMDRDGLRGSLIARFREKREGGQEFFFMVNHLERGRGDSGDEGNERQSGLINQWARGQTIPIINVGDFNYDIPVNDPDPDLEESDRGIDELTEDKVFRWVRPTTLVKTQHDDRFSTVLDFVFVGNTEGVKGSWSVSSRILNRSGDRMATRFDFGDTRLTADHRPVDAIFQLVDGPRGESMEERIAALEAEILRLRERVAELEREE